MNINIILGLGYGDEGKGSFVNYLSKYKENPLVIRHSGGHQVGHTVVVGDKRHVFSNYGSGSLLNVPTYWSEYCTVNPMGVFKEGKALELLGVKASVIYNNNAMITTPFDILRNQMLEDKNLHGSVGVGFGTTIQRNEDHYHLYVRDLYYPKVRDYKLELLMDYYYKIIRKPNSVTDKVIVDFKNACDYLVNNFTSVNSLKELLDTNPYRYENLIFEGSQGIMLDTEYGFFPNVTRAHTTSKNAISIIEKTFGNVFQSNMFDFNTYYITRSYQTRHGNGYLTNEELDTSYIQDNPNETNIENPFQGKLRKSVLDVDLLKHAISCDEYLNPNSTKIIVMTCIDQVPQKFPVTFKGELMNKTWLETLKLTGINKFLGSFSEEGCGNLLNLKLK